MSTEDNRQTAVQEPVQEAEVTEEQLTEQRKIRREKLKALQEAGRNPFLHEKWDVTAHSMDIKDNFEAMDGQEVSIAGRLMAFRHMGKASFVDIQDKQGRIQVFVGRDQIGADEYQWFKTYDRGDILGIEGTVFKTRTGETSVKASRSSFFRSPSRYFPTSGQDLRTRIRDIVRDTLTSSSIPKSRRPSSSVLSASRNSEEFWKKTSDTWKSTLLS